MQKLDERLVVDVWRQLGGRDSIADAVSLVGEAAALPSRYEVTALAGASVAVSTLAVSELWATLRGAAVSGCRVTRRHAAAAFRCERFVKPEGWELPPPWDPIAGDYEAADGWLRLHTNYAHHRDATLSALGVPAERAAVATAVRRRTAEDVESAVVTAGGAAAALRTPEAWASHPAGRAIAGEPLFAMSGELPGAEVQGGKQPLSGLRVLDLTRVIAGPVGTRFLAAFGADVLRIDPPAFDEVPALLPETTRGKRCAFVDLRTENGQRTFDALIARAHVLVHGHRFGSLDSLGYTADRLRALNPALMTARVDAYGYSGPWAQRRGFDSLVQMSTGIAALGENGKPAPLPAQALDHATGYLLAAAVCRALVDSRSEVRLSLARTAKLLTDLGTGGNASARSDDDATEFMERVETDWGPLRTVQIPGHIDGTAASFTVPPGPLGRHEPVFGTSTT